MHPARSGKSLNRSVAEIASDFGKPGGVTVVSQEISRIFRAFTSGENLIV